MPLFIRGEATKDIYVKYRQYTPDGAQYMHVRFCGSRIKPVFCKANFKEEKGKKGKIIRADIYPLKITSIGMFKYCLKLLWLSILDKTAYRLAEHISPIHKSLTSQRW